MMRYNFLLFFVILCILTISSCIREKNQTVETNPILINLSDTTQLKGLESIIEIEKIIPLNCSDSSTISSSAYIKKILVIDENFYILDGKYMQIPVFNNKGKHLFNLGDLGTKRGRFSNIQDMIYRPDRNTILVLCNTPNKIIEFTPSGGVVKEHFPSFFSSKLVYESEDDFYFYINNNQSVTSREKELLKTDSSFRIKYRLFDNNPDQTSSIGYTGGLFKSENKVLYNRPFDRNIYNIDNGNAVLTYQVDFGPLYNIDSINFDSTNYYIKNKSFLRDKIISFNKYLGFNYRKKGKNIFCLADIYSGVNYTSDFSEKESISNLFNEEIFLSEGNLMMLFTPRFKRKIFEKHSKEIIKRYPILKKFIYTNENECLNPYILILRSKN